MTAQVSRQGLLHTMVKAILVRYKHKVDVLKTYASQVILWKNRQFSEQVKVNKQQAQVGTE